jgi:Transglycosylase SLT domain
MQIRTLSLAIWFLSLALPASAGDTAAPWRLCATYAASAERNHRMPRGLLRAIAKVETGRYRAAEGEVLAWPWTVMAEGRGRYLPSKQAAIAEVEALRARGVRNIDVGCMQINLFYHPDAFDSLEAAFDPAANTQAAARILVDLKDTWGSWTRAVGNYHSNTPTLSGPYRVKVYRTLFKDRQRAARAELRKIQPPKT